MVSTKIISVIGPGKTMCSSEIYSFGLQLGQRLIEKGYFISCGGMSGLMEAVCKGARQAKNYQFGCTIGIIPTLNKQDANPYCDIVIPTGLGMARNQLVVSTADLIIALNGGAGTLSELAIAWQFRKRVICYTGFEGWSQELAGQNIDRRSEDLFQPAHSLASILLLVDQILAV
ncbi:MAG: TIGR00725 family protein [Candidatus Cyclobacteriaceae bacterium M3_2C_046]